MTLVAQIKCAALDALKHLFPEADITMPQITINQTKPEFTGDYTLVLFPFLKTLRSKPDVLGKQLGDYLVEKANLFTSYDVVAGFLNLSVKDNFWPAFLLNNFNNTTYGEGPKHDCRIMVEYSSPNTNKPLHFGHLRNNFLGYAMAEVLRARGNAVVKANLVNDRGIHICKSMVAWQQFANGATPESAGVKGDHLVGDYYVKFNSWSIDESKKLLEEISAKFNEVSSLKELEDYEAVDKNWLPVWKGLLESILANDSSCILKNDEFKNNPVKWFWMLKDGSSYFMSEAFRAKNNITVETRRIISSVYFLLEDRIPELPLEKAGNMLKQWEANDPIVRELWTKMNGWVYQGFDKTYKKLGISFDKMYYESDTYLLGKAIVAQGLQRGILFQKEDGSVWIDLTDDGLDQKLLLRGDGTSVYMTQDIGTARLKYDDFKLNKSVYVIADEQNYHMQVLKLILKKLGEPCADGIFHLSYGMVELPSGRMKSREGTVVDADDMIDEMVRLAQEQTETAGKTEGFSSDELTKLYEMIGLGALKFYLLRVDPKKKMIFDPKESIDLHGFTATFIQYAHARICSILRRESLQLLPDRTHFQQFTLTQDIAPAERSLLISLEQYPSVLEAAEIDYNPSLLCNYAFSLAQSFNTFYDVHSIANAESEEKKALRLMIIIMTAQVLRHSMNLLGIKLPEKM